MAGQIVGVRGDVFGVILIVFGVEASDAGRCVKAGGAGQGGDCSTLAGTNRGGRKERGQTSPRPELIEAGGRSVSGKIVEVRGEVFEVILIVFEVDP